MKKQIFKRLLWWIAPGSLTVRRKVSAGNSERIEDEMAARTKAALEAWVQRKGFLERRGSVAELAESLGISQAQLSYYCRTRMGKPFITWRKGLRMKEAARMLAEHPDMPVKVAAELCGVSDKTNFRREFKEVMGCTPAEWKARHCRS